MNNGPTVWTAYKKKRRKKYRANANYLCKTLLIIHEPKNFCEKRGTGVKNLKIFQSICKTSLIINELKKIGQELRHPLYFSSFFQSICMEVFPILHRYKGFTVFTVLHLCKTSIQESKKIWPGASPPIIFFQFFPVYLSQNCFARTGVQG